MEEKLQKNELKGSNKNVVIAILVVIIIALMGVGVYFAFIKKEDQMVITYYKYYDNTSSKNKYTYNKSDINSVENVTPIIFTCPNVECNNVFKDYQINNILFDTDVYGFVLSNKNKYVVYSIADEKVYNISTDYTINEISWLTIYKAPKSYRDYVLVKEKKSNGEMVNSILNYKTNKTIFVGNDKPSIIKEFYFGNDLYVISSSDDSLDDTPSKYLIIVDKNMNVISENKKIVEIYWPNDKEDEIAIFYKDDNEVYIYDRDGKIEKKDQKKGDLILVGDSGYYVSYISGSTRLFDNNNNELAILANKKLSISSITGFWDVDDVANMLYIGINLTYEKGQQYCIENGKEVESYSYYLSTKKVISEKEGVCKDNMIETN